MSTNNKNLPIKFFSKREVIDERAREGGGGEDRPWVLSGEELEERVKILTQDLVGLKETLKIQTDIYGSIPSIIKVNIIEGAKAKTYRKDINNLFLKGNKDNVVGLNSENELLVRVDNINELMIIQSKIQDSTRNKIGISAIEKIKIYDPVIDIEEITKVDGRYLTKVKLHDFNNLEINKSIYTMFIDLMNELDSVESITPFKYAERLIIFQVISKDLDYIKKLEDFKAIMSIQKMPLIENFKTGESPIEQIQLVDYIEGSNYPVIGVLDGGIEKIKDLEDWIVDCEVAKNIKISDKSHGTFIAGTIVHGEQLEGISYIGRNGCKILDGVVIPDLQKQLFTEVELIENIEYVISNHCDKVKIWSLSISTQPEIDYNNFSEFAIALDYIQDKYNVLIIKSAGNCNNYIHGKATGRISGGADSVRSITIGSVANKCLENDLAKLYERSPFSRVGPGPSNIIKPELVHFGGNVCKEDIISENPKFESGISSFNTNGELTKSVGTSYSTPKIAALAAHLVNDIKEEFDPLLIKGLLIHNARYDAAIEDYQEKVNHYGFGFPGGIDDILYNDKHEATLILRDNIIDGEFFEILEFPFPNSLVNEEGYFYGEITVTLVGNPLLGSNQGSEYCQSNVDIYLGSYDTKVDRDITKPTIKNPIGRSGGGNILVQSPYSKAKRNDSFTRTERTLISYGNKFYPVKKYSVDLGQMTPANKDRYLKSPKQWYLKIEALYREFIERNAEIMRQQLSQEFCAIITIKDPLKKHDVNTEVTNLLEHHNFIYRDIRINVENRIKINN